MVTLFVINCVLMRVVVGREAWWGGEEVLKWPDVNGGVKYRERLSNR